MLCEKKGLHLQNDSQGCKILFSHRKISVLKHLKLDVVILCIRSFLKYVAAKSGNQRARLRQRGKMLRKNPRCTTKRYFRRGMACKLDEEIAIASFHHVLNYQLLKT